MGVQFLPRWLRAFPNPRRKVGRSLRPAPRARGRGDLVGSLHGPDGCRSDGHPRRTSPLYLYTFFVGSWRSCNVSGLESIRSALDSEPRTRYRKWMDFRRSGCRGRPLAPTDYLHHAPLWLEGLVLGLRRHWLSGRGGI